MGFDSKGTFHRKHNWEQDRIDDIDIVTDHMDQEDDNFADGLSECFLRSGQVEMKGNLDIGKNKIVNLSNGTKEKDGINRGQLDEVVKDMTAKLNSSLMIGDIKQSALQTNHGSWLICDGRAVLRTSYDKLFEAIGSAFGEGDGVTTFNLPDCRGLVVRGCDNERGIDVDRVLGSKQEDSIKDHEHRLVSLVGYVGQGTLDNDLYLARDSGYGEWYGSSLGGTTTKATKAKTGSVAIGKDDKPEIETRMKNIALNFFIKAKED